ncbi:metallophosphoesterase [Sporomusa aerivorans]|uniref:metallophosphoesterase n=1 Tax=Sporomusa aerivorans TaxID=204936 RepID=UPI00352AA4A5
MQHGPSIFSVLFLLLILAGITWLGGRILSKWHVIYAGQKAKCIYWGATLLALGILIFSRWLRPAGGFPGEWFRYLIYFSYIWLVGLVFMLVVLLAGYIVRKLMRKLQTPAAELAQVPAGQDAAQGVTRRQFLQGALAAVPAIPFAISTYGVIGGDRYITTNRYRLSFPQLPKELEEFRIAQISDTHIGPFFGMDKLDKVLTVIKQEKPHLLVITGDLVDDLDLLAPTMERLTAFQSELPYGIFYCWGNHEYFRDIGRIRKALYNSPITVLENSNKAVAGKLYLAGVDYPWSKNRAEQEDVRRRYFSQAAAGIPADAFPVLLAHHPDFFDNAFSGGVPLTLAGHTHGGQVNIFGKSLLPVEYKYMRGLYRQGDFYGYVSVGTGHWLPLRIGCPAEISVFTLTGGLR